MLPGKNRQSRSLLIYPRFQLKLLAVNLLIMLLVCASVAVFTHHSFLNLIQQGANAKLPPDNPYFSFMAYQERLILGYIAVGLLVGVALSAVGTLIVSHRVAGPIVRMRGFFARVTQAAEEKAFDSASHVLAFRKGDFFEDLPAQVNRALSACASQAAQAGKVDDRKPAA